MEYIQTPEEVRINQVPLIGISIKEVNKLLIEGQRTFTNATIRVGHHLPIKKLLEQAGWIMMLGKEGYPGNEYTYLKVYSPTEHTALNSI